jgi:hypothetical protein
MRDSRGDSTDAEAQVSRDGADGGTVGGGMSVLIIALMVLGAAHAAMAGFFIQTKVYWASGLCAFNAAVAAFSVGVVLFASMACGVA